MIEHCGEGELIEEQICLGLHPWWSRAGIGVEQEVEGSHVRELEMVHLSPPL